VSTNIKIDDPTVWPKGLKKWTPLFLLQLALYLGGCAGLAMSIPNNFWDNELHTVVLVLGGLGIWRYSWWFIHAIRAVIYGKFVYPRMRRKADLIWQSGWRPRHLHFMMTTYKEHVDITQKVVRSIIQSVRHADVPATIWLGSSVRFDENVIISMLKLEARDIDLNLRIIRQNVSGKRAAIGLVLRAMSRLPVHEDDLITFMDGDFIIAPGAIEKCMTLFKLRPSLQACTTDEEVICIGPRWISTWLEMRFSQRRLAMQSHALSNRVLTLTGRMSVFRAKHLVKTKFIRTLEADHLTHWLWGQFRFLSGDDKSTWYYLLGQRAEMLYVPDALGYTVEVIEGSGMDRMVQNFRRWSGNMLRNGMRAIQLGPRHMPFFIWWCLVDQRLSMWTMLVSPILALLSTLLYGTSFLLAYILFIAISRLALSLFLFFYARRVTLAYPAILYFNQLINASVKVYCVWRLSKQRWSNRGNQTAGMDSQNLLERFRNTMAFYCTSLSVACLALGTIIYAGLLELPNLTSLKLL